MSSRPRAERRQGAARAKGTMRALAAAVAFGALLAGCSDPGLYLDRRDSIALDAGDALAANKVTQMYDPWPPHSGNTNIPYNGDKAASAVERYRTNKVTQPVDPMGLQTSSQSPPTLQAGGAQNNNAGANAAAAGSSSSGVSTAGQ
jgi:hypothetical protein